MKPSTDDPFDHSALVKRALSLSAIPPQAAERWKLTSHYFETAWCRVLGPTATLLARRLGQLLEQDGGVEPISIETLSHELGVPPSKVRDALHRLQYHGIVSLDGAIGTLQMSGSVAPAPQSRDPDRQAHYPR